MAIRTHGGSAVGPSGSALAIPTMTEVTTRTTKLRSTASAARRTVSTAAAAVRLQNRASTRSVRPGDVPIGVCWTAIRCGAAVGMTFCIACQVVTALMCQIPIPVIST
jgi:hypothetical protein